MPVYAFKDEQGVEAEHFFNSSEAPSIGATVVIEGKNLKRIPAFNVDTAGIARKTHKYPYVSRSLCRNAEGCQTNAKGQPIITSQRHEREVAARHDMAKD